MKDIYGIPSKRDMAKQVTAQKEIFTLFGKVVLTGEAEDFIICSREMGVLYGTANALEAKQKEEQQENNVEIENAIEQLKYKREERERRLREQREREKAQIAEYLNRARSAVDKTEAVKWYQKAAEQGFKIAKEKLKFLSR